MLDRILARSAGLIRRLRRFERRELASIGRWIQHTGNLLHLTVLVAVPLLIAVVTIISNVLTELSFLLFPPLAAGAYTLFSDPEGRYASPRRFVVGLVVGALCGWAALALPVTPAGSVVSPLSAALSIFLTGAVTWLLDVEEPAAFSTALLVLVTDDASPEAYVASVATFGTLVAAVFGVWRSRFYERRARYLYDTAGSDDHVLVPMRGDPDGAETTAIFGATLAAAHDAGKVVLLAILDETGKDGTQNADANTDTDADVVAGRAAERLESVAKTVRTRAGVPCEVVVARGPAVSTTVETAANTNCDLVVAPYEEDRGLLSPYVRGVFDSRYDTVAVRTTPGRRRWRRVLVMVARPAA
jgi:nucleotide-binding universal stress UspA family protein